MTNQFSSLMPVYDRAPYDMVRGDGSYLIDSQGRRHLDFAAGIAVNSFGHCHPRLVEALEKQARTLWHVSNLYESQAQEKVAKKLSDISFADLVFFTNSGVEAVECAIKAARRYHYIRDQVQKYEIISFENAFHGRSFGAISASNQKKLRAGCKPLLPGFTTVPFNDLKAVEDAITDQTAAILLEPIQGEGGIVAAHPQFLSGLRRICDQQNILLIFDEIQCGFGRTGKLFAYEHWAIAPDIMTIAKGLGGGFPIGACLATKEAASGMVAGTHGSTFSGNPLAMAVANAAIDLITEDGFLDKVANMGKTLFHEMQQICTDHDRIFDTSQKIRGLGLMLGLPLRVPNQDFVAHARRHGFLSVPGGDNVMRLLPPLVISPDDIQEAVRLLSNAARDFPID